MQALSQIKRDCCIDLFIYDSKEVDAMNRPIQNSWINKTDVICESRTVLYNTMYEIYRAI